MLGAYFQKFTLQPAVIIFVSYCIGVTRSIRRKHGDQTPSYFVQEKRIKVSQIESVPDAVYGIIKYFPGTIV